MVHVCSWGVEAIFLGRTVFDKNVYRRVFIRDEFFLIWISARDEFFIWDERFSLFFSFRLFLIFLHFLKCVLAVWLRSDGIRV